MLIFHSHVGVVGGVNWQHASPFQVEFSLMIYTENAGNDAALRVPPRRPSVRWMRRWPPLTVAFDGSRQVGGSLYKWSQWNPGEREVYANELWVPVFWFVNYVKNPGGDHVDGNYCSCMWICNVCIVRVYIWINMYIFNVLDCADIGIERCIRDMEDCGFKMFTSPILLDALATKSATTNFHNTSQQELGGGFKYFLFSPPFGEDSQFD